MLGWKTVNVDVQKIYVCQNLCTIKQKRKYYRNFDIQNFPSPLQLLTVKFPNQSTIKTPHTRSHNTPNPFARTHNSIPYSKLILPLARRNPGPTLSPIVPLPRNGRKPEGTKPKPTPMASGRCPVFTRNGAKWPRGGKIGEHGTDF